MRHHLIQVNKDRMVFPDGNTYNSGALVTLTPEQYKRLRPALLSGTDLTDLGATLDADMAAVVDERIASAAAGGGGGATATGHIRSFVDRYYRPGWGPHTSTAVDVSVQDLLAFMPILVHSPMEILASAVNCTVVGTGVIRTGLYNVGSGEGVAGGAGSLIHDFGTLTLEATGIRQTPDLSPRLYLAPGAYLLASVQSGTGSVSGVAAAGSYPFTGSLETPTHNPDLSWSAVNNQAAAVADGLPLNPVTDWTAAIHVYSRVVLFGKTAAQQP